MLLWTAAGRENVMGAPGRENVMGAPGRPTSEKIGRSSIEESLFFEPKNGG
jgi:hypothetical protein